MNSTWLDLFDYRQQVANLYRERNHALIAGEDPVEVAAQWRRKRDLLFARHPQSALDPEQRQAFTGLRYFPYNTAAVVEAGVHTDIEPMRIQVVTSGDETMPLERVAELRFSLAGNQASLALYWIDVYGGGFYLCFRDTTAPIETYGGGRYLFDTVKGSDFLVPPGIPSESGSYWISITPTIPRVPTIHSGSARSRPLKTDCPFPSRRVKWYCREPTHVERHRHRHPGGAGR